MAVLPVGSNYLKIAIEASIEYCHTACKNFGLKILDWGKQIYKSEKPPLAPQIKAPISPPPARPQKDLRMGAQKGMEYTLKNIVFSANHPNRNKYILDNHQSENCWNWISRVFSSKIKSRYAAIDHALKDVRDLMEAGLKFSSPLSPTDRRNIANWMYIAKLSEKYSIGNCLEMSAVLFKYLILNTDIKRIDILKIKNGDHVFIVIGKGEKRSPSDLVCDPWATPGFGDIDKQIYPYFELPLKLRDYKGVCPFTFDPIVRRIDLDRQRLSVIARYIRPSR